MRSSRSRHAAGHAARARTAAALALATFAITACSALSRPAPRPDPAKARRTVLLSTEADDQRVGEEQTKEAIAEFGTLRDEDLQAYVQRVGERVARHARARTFGYRFQVTDAWTPNAFALPGGAIFVSRGLLALTSSEDELANVLAHEIIHTAQRHAAAAQEWRRRNPFSLGLYGAMRFAAYTRDLEREADEAGQRLAAQAGYDPAGMSSFLRKLDQLDRVELGAPRLQSFLETHPGLLERGATTFARSSELSPAASDAIARSPEGFLRRLEGIVLGDDPAQGVFLGSRFVHPDLDIGITFPEGWRLANTPRMVAAVSPSGNARFSLEFAGDGDDPRVPAGAFLAEEAPSLGIQIVRARSLEINGRRAYEVEGTGPSPQGSLSGLLTWIAHGGHVYRISAVAPSMAARGYIGRARTLVHSFRPLTPEERDEVYVDRLALTQALPGETLEALVARTGSGWDLGQLGALNGMLPGRPLGEGTWVKIVRSDPYEPDPEAEDVTPAPSRPSGATGS